MLVTGFRGAVREIAADYGVRVAKWLGDGVMFVSTERPSARERRCSSSQRRVETTSRAAAAGRAWPAAP